MYAWSKVLVPGEFHFVQAIRAVGVKIDLAEPSAHARVKAAGVDVDVLGFDLELRASPVSGKCFNAIEERPSHAPSPVLRTDANIPQTCTVLPPVAEVQPVKVKHHDRPADSLFFPERAQKQPFRQVPRTASPSFGAFEPVVVLDVRRIHLLFNEP